MERCLEPQVTGLIHLSLDHPHITYRKYFCCSKILLTQMKIKHHTRSLFIFTNKLYPHLFVIMEGKSFSFFRGTWL